MSQQSCKWFKPSIWTRQKMQPLFPFLMLIVYTNIPQRVLATTLILPNAQWDQKLNTFLKYFIPHLLLLDSRCMLHNSGSKHFVGLAFTEDFFTPTGFRHREYCGSCSVWKHHGLCRVLRHCLGHHLPQRSVVPFNSHLLVWRISYKEED